MGRVGRKRERSLHRIRNLVSPPDCFVPPSHHHQRIGALHEQLPFPLTVSDPAGECDPAFVVGERLLEPVATARVVAKVVVGAKRRRRQVVLEGEPQRTLHQCPTKLQTTFPGVDEPVRVQDVGERLGKQERLGEIYGELEERRRAFEVADEELEAPQLAGESGKVGVGLVVRNDRERPFHPLNGSLELAGMPLRPPEARQDSGRWMCVTTLFEEADRALEVRSGIFKPRGGRCHLARTLAQLRLRGRIVRELRRLREVPGRLLARRKRRGTLACPRERLTCFDFDLVGVRILRRGAVRIQVVRRDNLDNLRVA